MSSKYWSQNTSKGHFIEQIIRLERAFFQNVQLCFFRWWGLDAPHGNQLL